MDPVVVTQGNRRAGNARPAAQPFGGAVGPGERGWDMRVPSLMRLPFST